ncbi:hypothetical protein RF11_12395 [Thelohanellus kitauei]|uniref:Uncharacterized protein n=1 Tax=Thelohanellus kitauei TaxID=669202 RepID=A0A0C2MFB2_THEKT|nr:hypothetical protein RF11_12395 [Thelohanellus kitauei]
MDECDKVEMIRNRHRPDFFLILTKCSHALGTGKGSLYTYDPAKSDFKLVELKTSAGMTKLDEVIPTGDMMLCISKSKNVTFLIDNTLQIKNLQPLVPNYKYYPHPDHPNIMMRYPTESKVCMTSFTTHNIDLFKNVFHNLTLRLSNWHRYTHIDCPSPIKVG